MASVEKTSDHTGPAEKERVATERAVGRYGRAAFAKRNIAPNREVEESQGEREPHLGG